MASTKSRERMARNFVQRYGAERFDRLMSLVSEGMSGQTIADEFDVSRERVRQWKNAFGQVIVIYQVYPEVQQVLDEELGPVYDI
jgi:hypothetical protein